MKIKAGQFRTLLSLVPLGEAGQHSSAYPGRGDRAGGLYAECLAYLPDARPD